MRIEDAVSVVRAHPDYRILERFRPVSKYDLLQADLAPSRGAYVDVETTGNNPRTALITELAIVPFTYTPEGIATVEPALTFLNDPGVPLDPKIVEITGITDEMVRGQKIDYDAVTEALNGVDLVVAHNAGFDRKMVEPTMPIFEQKVWGCSQQDVPWRTDFGALTERLEALAMMVLGVFYDAHRADIDCLIGIHLLAKAKDATGRTAFSRLLENVHRESVRVWACNAPFSVKDLLSARGYRWNDGKDGRHKAWHKAVSLDELEAENEWLRTACWASPAVTTCTAIDRYSFREK